ncbi:hypothetical protein HK104_005274 [Borealophlyctis nickersoniae]|nr:hypothetical protein HK104_005274 [Borealophlyctis nickersoniae]
MSDPLPPSESDSPSPPRSPSPPAATAPHTPPPPAPSERPDSPEDWETGSETEEEDASDHEAENYWCHQCQTEIIAVMDSGTPTCPFCEGDFVEEIEDDDDPRAFGEEDEDENLNALLGAVEPDIDGIAGSEGAPSGELAQLLQMWLQQVLGGGTGTSLTAGQAAAAQSVNDGGRSETRVTGGTGADGTVSNDAPLSAQGGSDSDETSNDAPINAAPVGGRSPSTIDIGITTGPDGRPMIDVSGLLQQAFGGEGQLNPLMNLLNMVGNPGDYVFGQQGLDEVITQLMEQHTQRNQPPAATEEVIKSLSRLSVRKTELGEHTECSVCQDDFEEGEELRKLPCKHLFHPHCIESWLKVNGTCPVCRYSLVGTGSGASTQIEEEETSST